MLLSSLAMTMSVLPQEPVFWCISEPTTAMLLSLLVGLWSASGFAERFWTTGSHVRLVQQICKLISLTTPVQRRTTPLLGLLTAMLLSSLSSLSSDASQLAGNDHECSATGAGLLVHQ